MDAFQKERLVIALEKIAAALAGIDETGKKQFANQWPERKEPRQAVYSRVPTEEDRLREQHGASNESLEEWLAISEETDFIGPREREFSRRQTAGSQAAAIDRSDSGGTETPES